MNRSAMYIMRMLAGVIAALNVITIQSAAANNVSANDVHAEFTGDVPLYQELALDAGIEHRYEGPWEYFVGGGVSSFDCNGDRLPDLFFAGGTKPAALYINQSTPAGELRFELSPETSLALSGVTGSYPIDIDNDGLLDLVVLRVGSNQLFKGEANCQFKPANAIWGFDGGTAWTTAFSATFETGNALSLIHISEPTRPY